MQRIPLFYRTTILASLLLCVATSTAQTSAPTADRAGAGVGRGQVLISTIDRMRNAIAELQLTDDQRSKANALLDNTITKLESLRDEPPDTRQAKFRETMTDMRQQLATVIPRDQLQQLRDTMQANASTASSPTTPGTGNTPGVRNPLGRARPTPNTSTVSNPTTHPTDTMMMTDPAMAAAAAHVTIDPNAAVADPIAIGSVAPDFKLTQLDGPPLQLAATRGKVVVLLFGSYSSPTFRTRSPAFNQLFHDESGKASIYMVYTKEAHAIGGWELEKNKQDNIQIEQPTKLADRRASAIQCHVSLHLAMPIIVDDMQNTAATAYGCFPNGAVVINRDGTIATSEQWAEPTALRRAIDAVVVKGK